MLYYIDMNELTPRDKNCINASVTRDFLSFSGDN